MSEAAFWDVYYEHCNYFADLSLWELFASNGFTVLSIEEEYDGQYLGIATRLRSGQRSPGVRAPLDELRSAAEGFAASCKTNIEWWRAFIASKRRERVVLWGGGSKGVAFLTTIGIQDEISYVVDINPRRQNTWLAGGRQMIVAPEFLTEYRPGTVIVMNPIYRDEIQRTLHNLDLEPEIAVCA